MAQQIILHEDVEGCQETGEGCISGTGCSWSELVPPCLKVLWKQKKVPPLSSSVVIVELSAIVQGNVNRNTGDNIRHFARPYPLWKSENTEKTERRQVSL